MADWQITVLMVLAGTATGLLWNISAKIDAISQLMHSVELRRRGD